MAKLRKRTTNGTENGNKPTKNGNENKQKQSIKNKNIKMRKCCVKLKRLKIKNIDLILNNNNDIIVGHQNAILNISPVKTRATRRKMRDPDREQVGATRAVGLSNRNQSSNNSATSEPLHITPVKSLKKSIRVNIKRLKLVEISTEKKIERKETPTKNKKLKNGITSKSPKVMAKRKTVSTNVKLNEENKSIRMLKSQNNRKEQSKLNEDENKLKSLEKDTISLLNEGKMQPQLNVLEKNLAPLLNESEIESQFEKNDSVHGTEIEPQLNVLEKNFAPLLNESEIESQFEKNDSVHGTEIEPQLNVLEKNHSPLLNEIEITAEEMENQENILPENKQVQSKFSRLSLGAVKRDSDICSKNIKSKNVLKPSSKSNSGSSSVKKSKRLLNLESTKSANNSDKDNIYEFQSSQSSPADKNDPENNIILKLAKAGKIEIVKYKKGSGKLKKNFTTTKKTLKKPVKKPVKKSKPNLIVGDKELNVSAKAASEYPKKEINNKLEDHNLHNINVQNTNEINFDFEDIHNELPLQNTMSSNFQTFNLQSPNLDISTNYSPLARKVMKRQTSKLPLRRRITDAKELLNYAKKFVQTGRFDLTGVQKQPHTKSPGRVSDDSKNSATRNISKNSLNLPSIKSPWRVPDDPKLPKTFNFSRNSQNLPSYSSDFIAVTPKKSAGKKTSRHELSFDTDESQLNDSNAENIPIENVRNIVEVNPNKGLSKRTPLKIIEVINLPRLAFNQISTPKNKMNTPRIETTISDDNEQNISLIAPLPNLPSTSTSYKRQTEVTSNFVDLTRQNRASELTSNFVDLTWCNKAPELTSTFVDLTGQNNIPDSTKNISENLDDLFGFEDELNENDNMEYSKTNENNKMHLKTKLKRLKRLLPKTKAKPTRFEVIKPLKNIFNDGSSKEKQSNIKQIFSSTMIENKNQEANKSSEVTNLASINEDADEDVFVTESGDPHPKTLNLFGDVTEINNSTLNSTIRTYTRPKKKIRHNFITCMDSDEEETDNSPKKKRKGIKKDQVNEEELSRFYDNFNSACEEIDHFELVIEKDNTVE